MTVVPPDRVSRPSHPGFTLMEALMASAILFAGVLAVISAIMTGQEEAFDAQRRMQAALATDDLMGRIATMAYDDLIGLSPMQAAGPFLAMTSSAVVDEELPNLDIRVRGIHVHVEIVPSLPEASNVLAEADLFIPAPPP